MTTCRELAAEPLKAGALSSQLGVLEPQNLFVERSPNRHTGSCVTLLQGTAETQSQIYVRNTVKDRVFSPHSLSTPRLLCFLWGKQELCGEQCWPWGHAGGWKWSGAIADLTVSAPGF